MSVWTLLALAVALAMDAFAVSVAAGVALGAVSGRQTFRLAWHFGLFQALMPILGWAAGRTVAGLIQSFDHWLAFGLLAFVGGRMVAGAFKSDGARPAGDPTRGVTLLVLSLATSVDALAVGLSMSLIGVSIWWPALVIGLVAGGFTAAGLHLGKLAGGLSRLGSWADLTGGLVLIGLGVRILVVHGVF